MFHVAFDRFDEVWNKVVTPGELYINLRESIFDTISQVDETIVNADCKKDDCGNQREENY
jgi:hypothetical protein